MEFLLVSLLAVVVYVIVSLRRQGEELTSMSAIDHAGRWLDARDINRDIRFVSYPGRPYAELEGATVLIGHGTDVNGQAVGFCVEIADPHGIVGAMLVVPVAVALDHKLAASHCRKTGVSLRTALAGAMIRCG